MKRYITELYFLKPGLVFRGLDNEPILDMYSSNTKLLDVNAASFKEAKKRIIEKFPEVSYIHLLDTNSLDY